MEQYKKKFQEKDEFELSNDQLDRESLKVAKRFAADIKREVSNYDKKYREKSLKMIVRHLKDLLS